MLPESPSTLEYFEFVDLFQHKRLLSVGGTHSVNAGKHSRAFPVRSLKSKPGCWRPAQEGKRMSEEERDMPSSIKHFGRGNANNVSGACRGPASIATQVAPMRVKPEGGMLHRMFMLYHGLCGVQNASRPSLGRGNSSTSCVQGGGQKTGVIVKRKHVLVSLRILATL